MVLCSVCIHSIYMFCFNTDKTCNVRGNVILKWFGETIVAVEK